MRVKPRRTLVENEASRLFFLPELHPVTQHPLIRARPPNIARKLLVHRLYSYLQFTSELESFVVVPVTADLSSRRAGLHLPPSMRHDAFKIVTDEAWHAQFSDDLARQVHQATGVDPALPNTPHFLRVVAAIQERVETPLRGAQRLLCSVVSETLISSVLTDLPQDRRLAQAVRDTVADHAEDEGKHHAYFRDILRIFWPALDRAQRRQLGPLVPELITAFLEPDHAAIMASLSAVGLTAAEAAQVMAESHPRDDVRHAVAAAAKTCVRYFAEVGALDDPATAEAFARHGLVDRSAIEPVAQEKRMTHDSS